MKKKFVMVIMMSLALCLVVGGISYAWLSQTTKGNKSQTLVVGNLVLTLSEKEAITLTNSYPMSDQNGLKTTPYIFTLQNTGAIHSNYAIYLDDVDLSEGEERMGNESLRYSIVRDGQTLKIGNLSEIEGKLIDQGLITAGTKYEYELRIWIKESAGNEVAKKVFKGKIRVVGNQIQGSSNETDVTCFSFNKTTGTITGYNNSCSKDVWIPEEIGGVTVQTIASNAFLGRGLTSLFVPSTVAYIGQRAFNNNQLPDNQAFIYGRNSDGSEDRSTVVGYGGSKRENIIIPSQVKTIEAFAFQGNQLKTVVIPEGVKEIKGRAFATNQLTHIEIPSTVTFLEGGAFAGNKLPDSEAFIYGRNSDGSINYSILNSYGGSRRDNIEIPSTVKELSSHSFYTNYLTRIVIPEGIKKIGRFAFEGNSLTSVSLPSTLIQIEGGAFTGNQLPDSEAFIYGRNSDGSIDKTTLASYGGSNLNNVVIPEGVQRLIKNSLAWIGITNLTLPQSLTTIENQAIQSILISSITIPPNVTKIEGNSLINLTKLRTIVNQTERSFNWKAITAGNGEATFVTGVIPHSNGNITVKSS